MITHVVERSLGQLSDEWFEKSSPQENINQKAVKIQLTIAVVGGPRKRRNVSIYTKIVGGFYIHIHLLFRLKYFNFIAFVVIVTMLKNCTQFWGYKNGEAITLALESLQTLKGESRQRNHQQIIYHSRTNTVESRRWTKSTKS